MRFRRYLFSIARQNGKSEICAVLSLYALVQHSKGGSVIGIATNRASAQIVYDRVRDAIRADRGLRTMFKATSTRGLRNLNTGSTYKVMPAKSDALQGHTISALGIVDEVHIVPEALWDDMVTSASAHENALIVGLTTAGSPDSTLLKRLYETAATDIDDSETSIGFSIFEGIEGAAMDDEESLLRANPIVACGRKSLATLLDEMQGAPDSHNKRYRHNLFVEEVDEPFISLAQWMENTGTGITDRKDLVFGIEVTPTWSWASISVARKRDDGVVETQLIASFDKPELEDLVAVAKHLKKSNPHCSFVMDTRNLLDLFTQLKDKGYTVYDLNRGGYQRMAATFLSLTNTKKISHNKDVLLTLQVPAAKTKNYGDGFAIAKGIRDIDAVKATAAAVYIANTRKKKVLQLF